MPAAPDSLPARLVRSLKRFPDKPFLRDTEETLSCREFLARVAARQGQVSAAGPRLPARVLIPGGRGTQFWVDMIAVWGLGCVAIPLGITTPKNQIGPIVELARPDITLGRHADMTEVPRGILCLDLPGQPEGPNDPLVATRGMPGHTACITFTSGSTGIPKGVVLTHQALLGNALASLADLEMERDDLLFMATPFNFISAISHFLVTALCGATLFATESRLMFGDLFAGLCDSGATCFGGSPLQLQWIAECAASQPIDLRWVMSSGDHLSTATIDAARTHLPQTGVFTVYGITEVSGRFCILRPDMIDQHAGSVGRPIDGLSVAILDEELRPLPRGEVGEVFVQGKYLLTGYESNPEATAAALTEHGFRTRDMGFLDDAGFLRLCGRADDVFKCHGEKVSAIPIVEALLATSAFADVAVIGWDDPVHGTVPRVFFVPADGTPFDRKKIVSSLRGKLPGSHLPRMFTPVPAIPRTASGKVRRLELRKLATLHHCPPQEKP